jgi:hypothetical protein
MSATGHEWARSKGSLLLAGVAAVVLVAPLAWRGQWVAALIWSVVIAAAVVMVRTAPLSLYGSGDKPGWRCVYSAGIAITLLGVSAACFRYAHQSPVAEVWKWIFGILFFGFGLLFTWVTYFWFGRWRAESSGQPGVSGGER